MNLAHISSVHPPGRVKMPWWIVESESNGSWVIGDELCVGPLTHEVVECEVVEFF